MLQIIVPLGGKAARFQERGYTFPKPLIEIGSRSMIEVVLENLAPPKPHQYTFICRKEHLAQFYLGDMLRLLAPGCRIIPLEQDTAGALCSVLLAIDQLELGGGNADCQRRPIHHRGTAIVFTKRAANRALTAAF